MKYTADTLDIEHIEECMSEDYISPDAWAKAPEQEELGVANSEYANSMRLLWIKEAQEKINEERKGV